MSKTSISHTVYGKPLEGDGTIHGTFTRNDGTIIAEFLENWTLQHHIESKLGHEMRGSDSVIIEKDDIIDMIKAMEQEPNNVDAENVIRVCCKIWNETDWNNDTITYTFSW